MDLEFFILGGYGQFIWPAFIFTFVSCIVLYKRTKKELQKQEKVFISEFRYLNVKKTNTFKEKKVAKEVLSASSF